MLLSKTKLFDNCQSNKLKFQSPKYGQVNPITKTFGLELTLYSNRFSRIQLRCNILCIKPNFFLLSRKDFFMFPLDFICSVECLQGMQLMAPEEG